jgi:adenylosuccinate synthase
LDGLYEAARGKDDIGTTKKGIGPCYMDKIERSGLRTCDMLDEKGFREKLSAQIDRKNDIIVKLFNEKPINKEELIETYVEYAKRLKPYIKDALDSMKQTVETLGKEVEKSKGYIARAEGQAQASKLAAEPSLLSLEG